MTATYMGWAPSDGGTVWAAASWSTTLLSLANNTMALSPIIDNTETTIGSAAYDEGFLQIDLGAATTVGSTLPISVSAVALDSLDGTNFTPAYVSGTTLYPLDYQRAQSFGASVSQRFIHVRGIVLRPALTKIAIINNLGVAFPATAVTTTFYRLRKQIG